MYTIISLSTLRSDVNPTAARALNRARAVIYLSPQSKIQNRKSKIPLIPAASTA